MRFSRHLSGDAWSKRDALTQFISSIRTMLDKIGNNRGEKILLSVRVPTWLERCKRLGIDISEWAKLA
ncbi:TPA: hypothetical protein ENX78_07360 [Candidatus Poribacteria bacterium]|nr:hypothetical protein [Candidatus Poribacteria bacterium]